MRLVHRNCTTRPRITRPPDACIDILYSSAAGLQVVGAMTAERRFDFDAHTRSVGVRFRPGMAAAFLRVPAA
jgi:hypothetical protein